MILASFFADTIENPTVCLVILTLFAVFLIAGFLISRQKIWLLPVLPLLLAGAGLILADQWILSPKEKVQIAISQCVAAVKSNQKEELLKHVAPELLPKVRRQVDWAFSLADFQHAYANDVKLELNEFTAPPTIRATFFAGCRFKPRVGFAPTDRYACVMTLVFEESEDGQWLITSHEERSALPGGAP